MLVSVVCMRQFTSTETSQNEHVVYFTRKLHVYYVMFVHISLETEVPIYILFAKRFVWLECDCRICFLLLILINITIHTETDEHK